MDDPSNQLLLLCPEDANPVGLSPIAMLAAWLSVEHILGAQGFLPDDWMPSRLFQAVDHLSNIASVMQACKDSFLSYEEKGRNIMMKLDVQASRGTFVGDWNAEFKKRFFKVTTVKEREEHERFLEAYNSSSPATIMAIDLLGHFDISPRRLDVSATEELGGSNRGCGTCLFRVGYSNVAPLDAIFVVKTFRLASRHRDESPLAARVWLTPFDSIEEMTRNTDVCAKEFVNPDFRPRWWGLGKEDRNHRRPDALNGGMILLTARPDAIGACLPRPKMAARTNAAYGRVVNFESIRAEVGAAPAISLAKMGTGGRNATRGYNVLAARVPLDAPVALIRLVTGTIVMGRSRFADLCRPLPVDGKTAGYFVKNDRGAR